MGINREERLRVFEDTEKAVKTIEKLKKAVADSTANQKLILEAKTVEGKKNEYEKDAEIIVSTKRSFEAAEAYKNKKVCVLNFASASNPGGGVTKGSSAQEECLCRTSTLYFSLNTKEMWDGFYAPHRAMRNPLHNDDIIYTPDVVVFKTDTDKPVRRREEEWFKVDVISCAAPNLRNMPSNSYNSGDGDIPARPTDEELYQIQLRRFKKILEVAASEKEEVLILGAFGCGAFENNPKVVAKATKDAVELYKKNFEVIEFAVFCTPDRRENYDEFRRIFNPKGPIRSSESATKRHWSMIKSANT